MQKKIERRYQRFFSELGINRKNGKLIQNGEFIHNRKWSHLRFPIYPYIGQKYASGNDGRVLFIALQQGTDPCTNTIIGLDALRNYIGKDPKSLKPHIRGMAVATIRFLRKPSKQFAKIFRRKKYKETCELAKEIDPNFNPVVHFAFTNCYKFITIGKPNAKLSAKDRRHVDEKLELELLQDEIHILRPHFLVFESEDFKRKRWSDLINKIKKQNKNTSVYISCHPSAQSLHQKTSKYLKTFKPRLMPLP